MPKSLRSLRYQVAVELSRGVLGALSVGHSPSRAVLLRRFTSEAPWNDALLDRLASSDTRAQVIHHPSLLAVVDAVRSPDGLTVATEYVQGVPLGVLTERAKERRRNIPAEIAQRIVLDLARAMAAADELRAGRGEKTPLQWIHPETVFVSSGDDALIADVGLLAFGEPPEHPLVAAYLAPELESGPSAGPSAVFSLGVLLWELIAGRDALGQSAPGASVAKVRERLAKEGIQRLDEVVKNLPPLLVETVMQSLDRDPKARFPDVSAFAEALGTGKKSRAGELVGFMTALAGDVVDKQRSELLHTSIAPASWRPTAHAIDDLMPEIPRAPRLVGIPGAGAGADFRHAEVSIESAKKVDALLAEVKSDPSAVIVPAKPEPAAPEREEQRPVPLGEAAPALAPRREHQPAVASMPDDDEPAFRPRRRWGLVLFVLLVIGGAFALIVMAAQKQQEQESADTSAQPASRSPTRSASVPAALAPSASASARPSAQPRATREREREPRHRDAADATETAPRDDASAPTNEKPELRPDFNPYAAPTSAPKHSPSAAPSSGDLGF